MSDLTVGNEPVDRGKIIFPRRGNWQAKFSLTNETFPVGATSGSFWGTAVSGFAKRSAAPYLQPQVYMIGGAGKLSSQTTPRDYRYASFAQVVRELLTDAGEVVDEESLVGEDQQLQGWTRTAGMVCHELDRLCATRNDQAGINDGTTWRVRPTDGKIEVRPLVEVDTSPNLNLLADHVTLHKRVYSVSAEETGLPVMPGDRFDGIIVDTVEYVIESDSLRLEVFYGPSSTSPLDRMAELWQKMFDAALARSRAVEVDPLGHYFGTIKSVRSNGNVDILADDPRISYVNDVPIYSGLPGLQLKPIASSPTSRGARVIFGWSGGNKNLKYAMAWGMQPDKTLDSVTIEAASLLAFTTKAGASVAIGENVLIDAASGHDVVVGGGGDNVACLGDKVSVTVFYDIVKVSGVNVVTSISGTAGSLSATLSGNITSGDPHFKAHHG